MRVIGLVLVLVLNGFTLLFSQTQQKPRNIIILIGDGMGTNYVSAAVLNLPNSPFRKFTTVGFSVTRAVDRFITESAASATAISTGHRTNHHYVGLDTLGNSVTNIFEEAEKLNLSTGLVVTCTVTHATAAAFVAHVISRKEETAIAKQFLDKDIDVVIGGGAKFFYDFGTVSSGSKGFDVLKQKGYDIYQNAEELFASRLENKFYGLLEKEHLKKAAERTYSLADLTKKALLLLSKNENGFVLMIEGSQIDWGGHNNNQEYIMTELSDFCGAINYALDFAEKDENTLVLVTSDHETGGMSINDGKIDGSELTMKFTTTGHTAGMVGVFAKGPGEELFAGVFNIEMIGRNLFQLINPDFKF